MISRNLQYPPTSSKEKAIHLNGFVAGFCRFSCTGFFVPPLVLLESPRQTSDISLAKAMHIMSLGFSRLIAAISHLGSVTRTQNKRETSSRNLRENSAISNSASLRCSLPAGSVKQHDRSEAFCPGR